MQQFHAPSPEIGGNDESDRSRPERKSKLETAIEDFEEELHHLGNLLENAKQDALQRSPEDGAKATQSVDKIMAIFADTSPSLGSKKLLKENLANQAALIQGYMEEMGLKPDSATLSKILTDVSLVHRAFAVAARGLRNMEPIHFLPSELRTRRPEEK